MKHIYVIEAIGELIGCIKSLKKCYDELKASQNGIASYTTVLKSIKEEDAYAYNDGVENNWNIRKTHIL